MSDGRGAGAADDGAWGSDDGPAPSRPPRLLEAVTGLAEGRATGGRGQASGQDRGEEKGSG
jgi:hypothetical protein